jgi:hypothetical protein
MPNNEEETTIQVLGEAALDVAVIAPAAVLGGVALGTGGAGVGAAIGMVAGPPGAAVGAMIGLVFGTLAGSAAAGAAARKGKNLIQGK